VVKSTRTIAADCTHPWTLGAWEMFNSLDTLEDLTKLVTASHALVYVRPIWSRQAIERMSVLVSAIQEIATAVPEQQIASFLVSDDSLDNPFFEWANGNLAEGIVIHPMIGCGAGAIVWTVQGLVVGFDANVRLLGVDGLVEKSRSLFMTT
jgi:hypothetical protein